MFNIFNRFIRENIVALSLSVMTLILLNLIFSLVLIFFSFQKNNLEADLLSKDTYRVIATISKPLSSEEIDIILDNFSLTSYQTRIAIAPTWINDDFVEEAMFFSTQNGGPGKYFFHKDVGTRSPAIKYLHEIPFAYQSDVKVIRNYKFSLSHQLLYRIEEKELRLLLHEDYGKEIGINEYLNQMIIFNPDKELLNNIQERLNKIGKHFVIRIREDKGFASFISSLTQTPLLLVLLAFVMVTFLFLLGWLILNMTLNSEILNTSHYLLANILVKKEHLRLVALLNSLLMSLTAVWWLQTFSVSIFTVRYIMIIAIVFTTNFILLNYFSKKVIQRWEENHGYFYIDS